METDPSKFYFIAFPFGENGRWYYSRLKSGKKKWTVKRGIAFQFRGGPDLDRALIENSKSSERPLIAEEVPADAHKRWRAKK